MNATLLAPFTRRRVALMVGALGLLVFVGFLWWSFSGSGLLTFGQDTVEFVFADGLNVVPRSSEVRVNGLEVGKVTGIHVEEIDGKSQVVVTAKIGSDVELKEDASAELALKSLLGEKMVNLDPGTASAPLAGGRVMETRVGADVTGLSSGGEGSARLYDNLGEETVMGGLETASEIAPVAGAEARSQLAQIRAMTDQLVAGQPELLATIGDVETLTNALVDAMGEIGSLIDTKRVIQARIEETLDRARTDWVRMEASMRILRDVMTSHEADIKEVLRVAEIAYTNSMEAYRLFRAGHTVPANFWGLGTLLDRDLREPGPNPAPPLPVIPLPTEEELEAE